jgi:hypothetical protein
MNPTNFDKAVIDPTQRWKPYTVGSMPPLDWSYLEVWGPGLQTSIVVPTGAGFGSDPVDGFYWREPICPGQEDGKPRPSWEEIMAGVTETMASIEAERRGVPVEVVKAEREAVRAGEDRRFRRQMLFYIGFSLVFSIAVPILAWRYLPNWVAQIISRF